MVPMGRLGALVAAYVAAGLVILVCVTLAFPLDPAIALPFSLGPIDPAVGGLVVWILVGVATSSRSSVDEGRLAVVFGVGPVVAAGALGGPAAAAWVGLLGSTEWRELSGRVPWYGVLANHAMIVIPAALGGMVMVALREAPLQSLGEARAFVPVMAGAATFAVFNLVLAYATVRLRTGRSFADAIGLPPRTLATMFTAESALGWVFAAAYQLVAWWSPVVLVVADVAAAASLDRGRAGWLARHHTLTHLPNRLALRERALDFARQRRFPLAVFYLDLNDFKAINDQYDHETGDRVLEVVARQLSAVRRSDDFLAHLHGDEFVVLAPGVASVAAAKEIANRLAGATSEPIALPDLTLEVSASVGFQIVNDVADLDRAIRDADRLMQQTKRDRRAPGPASDGRSEPRRTRTNPLRDRPGAMATGGRTDRTAD